MKIIDLEKLIESLKQNKGDTLGKYIKSMSDVYLKNNDKFYSKIIDRIIVFENITIEKFENYLLSRLFNQSELTDEEIEKANETIQILLDIKMNEYELWYKFIIEKYEEKVIYHTYHSTKGREFDNVIIIMENKFGSKKNLNYCNFFFENYMNSEELDGSNEEKFEQVKNLLYVACSRARKNLRILYIDDVTDFNSGIMEIFGPILKFREG